mmetsp:Transcript_19194/g.48335  ORF Transcript_19194/g.48335 Transcript_19194/m.48335 type:complete len:94 (+) Transcript_19194:516-797(+)
MTFSTLRERERVPVCLALFMSPSPPPPPIPYLGIKQSSLQVASSLWPLRPSTSCVAPAMPQETSEAAQREALLDIPDGDGAGGLPQELELECY